MYETTFKNIDDTLWKDAGCSSELDYIEQTSWILFLKYLDDFESDKETAALLNGETYSRIIDGEFLEYLDPDLVEQFSNKSHYHLSNLKTLRNFYIPKVHLMSQQCDTLDGFQL